MKAFGQRDDPSAETERLAEEDNERMLLSGTLLPVSEPKDEGRSESGRPDERDFLVKDEAGVWNRHSSAGLNQCIMPPRCIICLEYSSLTLFV